MQYLSSIILEWAPFLADPDFQVLVMAAMTLFIGFHLIKKSLKILAATLKTATIVAVIATIIYLFADSPKAARQTSNKKSQTQSAGQNVGKAFALIRQVSSELPTFVANIKSSIQNEPQT